MTALERQMAADAIALSKEHADRADAAEARAKAAEAILAAIRRAAREWAALSPADDWGPTPADTVAADCGRAILAIIGTDKAQP
jgi:hypothetical protein